MAPVDESAGRSRRRGRPRRRGTSGLHRAGWLLTATRGDPRESATESRPPGVGAVRRRRLVRVKRWCKRPPAPRVTGVARQTPPGARSRGSLRAPVQAFEGGPPEPAGRPLEPAGNGRPRWMTAHREAARHPWTESAGRSRRRGRPRRRGTSGLHRAGWSLTATRGDPRDSATENRPPVLALVRVKRRCKRPPHTG
jgi:transposase